MAAYINELFRFREEQTDGGAEANLFVTSLLEAANSFSVPIYVVLTMRSDFLGHCTQFPGLSKAELGDDTDQLPVLQHALNPTFRK